MTAVGKKKADKNEKKSKKASHVFSGDLTLQTIGEVKAGFASALASSTIINVSFQDVGDVDLSFIQLLCAAHRSAEKQEKKLEFTGAWPTSFDNLIGEAGLKTHVGCSLDGNVECPWLARK